MISKDSTRRPVSQHVGDARHISIVEQAFTCFVMLLSSGGLIGLLSGTVDLADPAGAPAIQLMWAVLYVAFALLLVRQKAWRRVVQRNLWLWLLVAFVFASSIWSDVPALTLRRSLALLGSTIVGLYIATRYSMRHYLGLLVISLSVGGVLSLFAIFVFPAFAIMHGGGLDGALRGVFLHRNGLGHAITLVVAVCSLLLLSARRRASIYAILVLSAVLLLLCGSKTALVVSVLLCFNGLLFRLLKSPHLFRWMMAICASLGTLAYLGVRHGDTLLELIGRDATLTGRTVLWGALLASLSKHPLLGYGYSAFFRGIEGPSGDVQLSAGWLAGNAHNGFLQLALDIGLVGLLLFLTVYAGMFRRALSQIWSRDPIAARWPVLFLVYLLIYNIDEASFVSNNSISWILFVALAFSLTPKSVRLAPHNKRRLARPQRIAELER